MTGVGLTGGSLLEREDALAALHGAYSECLAGSGRIALVSGEAGIGKTSLVRVFCDSLSDATRVLVGACEPLFTPRPLGPITTIAGLTGPELSLLVAAGSLHEITENLLAELENTPTVLVLEDIHWADEATLDVMRMLGRRITAVPGLVVATHRDDELDRTHALRVLLGSLAPVSNVARIRLEPLSQRAVTELAQGSRVDAVRLFEVTCGNPFFVHEVLEANDQVPATLRDATLARAARLDAEAADVLEVVAVTPPHADSWLIEELFDDPSGAVDDCVASGLLVSLPDGIAFRHELSRIAVEQSINPLRRRAAHKRVLGALESPPSSKRDLARLAHHAEGSSAADAVLRYAAAAAAEATAAGAHREAASQYARALRFGQSLTETDRADLLERRSDALYQTDDQQESVEVVTQAIAAYHAAGDVRREAAATGKLASRLICVASFDEAVREAAHAVGLLDGLPPSPELARAYAALAALQLNMADPDGAIANGEHAASTARRFDDQTVLIDALTTAGSARLLRDRADRATLDTAYELALRHDVGVARILSNYVSAALAHGDNVSADHYSRLALAHCRERQLDMWRLNVLGLLLHLRIREGRWDEALDIASQLESDPKESSGPRLEAVCAFARIRARRGDPGVHGALEQAAAADWLPPLFDWVGEIAVARAEIAWLEGKAGEIGALTERALALESKHADPWCRGALHYWRWKDGLSASHVDGLAEPYALQVAGLPLEAAHAWERLGRPYETALALSECDDVASLRRGHEIAVGLGARPLAQRFAKALRASGIVIPRGPRAATRENAAGLTARESEVLLLVAAGLRNADIAARLHLSPRTVDRHVSSILCKLDASTRGGAVAAARRLGIVADGS